MDNKLYTVTSKNLVPLCILKVLEKHSDSEHKLTQQDIISYLKSDYQIDYIDRKTVGRNITHLIDELEIDIQSDSKGSWIDERLFEDYELHMLIDSVFTSRYISKNYSTELIEKIASLGNEFFNSNVKYTYSVDSLGKTDNKSVFYNIEIVEEAIETGKQIAFDYNRYGADLKMHKTSHQVISPYRLLVHNQRYYLMGLNEKFKSMTYYRIDHINNMEIIEDAPLTNIRTVKGWENGISNENMATNMPYMFSDKHELIVFKIKEQSLDSMIDWLGFDLDIVRLKGDEDGYLKVSLKTSPNAMKYFALQYLDEMEILSPNSLRESIRDVLKENVNKYL